MPDDVDVISRNGDRGMLLLRRMRREAQVRPPGAAAIDRTLVIDLRLSIAVVIPDHVNAPGVISSDASSEVEAEQRIARSIRQATIRSPGIAIRRSSLKRRKPVVRKRARFDALRRLIGSVVCWRSDVRDGLHRARFGRNA